MSNPEVRFPASSTLERLKQDLASASFAASSSWEKFRVWQHAHPTLAVIAVGAAAFVLGKVL